MEKTNKNKKLNESFKFLSDIDNDDFFIEQYIETSLKLLDEGFTMEQIEKATSDNLGNKIDNTINKNGGSPIINAAKKAFGDTVIGNALLGGKASTDLVEQGIRLVILPIFGLNDNAKNFIAPIIANINPLQILVMFKDKNSCSQYSGQFALAILNGFINYLQFKGTSPNLNVKDIVKIEARNFLNEAIKDSNLPNVVGERFCRLIWK